MQAPRDRAGAGDILPPRASAVPRDLATFRFSSILFERPEDGSGGSPEAPPFFVDLNLDQVVAAVVAPKADYDLAPFFHRPLPTQTAIAYRHEVFRDLEDPRPHERVKAFAEQMHEVRSRLAQAAKLYYKHQKQFVFLDAVETYCGAAVRLREDLDDLDFQSRGFSGFRTYLADYVASPRFTTLRDETKTLKADLAAIRYSLLIKGSSITVRKYESETDYSAEVEATFRKFRQGAVKEYRAKFLNLVEMNHIEAGIMNFVAQLYPNLFATLDAYCATHADFMDETIRRFDREVQFYLAYLGHMAPLKRAGLGFCYPRVSQRSKEVRATDTFDLALAHKLLAENEAVVCNDFRLTEQERIIVVSGANQGGKTTFARTFGQLHYLASLGCPVPGRDAQLFLFDKLRGGPGL